MPARLAAEIFHADLIQPFEQQIISNNREVRIYDPDLEQLTIKPVNKDMTVTPLLLFSDNKQKITARKPELFWFSDKFDGLEGEFFINY